MAHPGHYYASRIGSKGCCLRKACKPGHKPVTWGKQIGKEGEVERLGQNVNQNTSKLLSSNGHCNCIPCIPTLYWRGFRTYIIPSLNCFNKKKTQGSI